MSEHIAKPESPAPEPRADCPRCGGSGWVRFTSSAHHPDCNGHCELCPIPVDDSEPCECVNEPVPATAAPSQPAREWMDVPLCADHAQTWFTARNEVQSPTGCWFCDAAQQSAAKDAELRQRDDDDRVAQEHTNSIIQKYEADLKAAERERDSLRADLDHAVDCFNRSCKRCNQLAALKAGKDGQQ